MEFIPIAIIFIGLSLFIGVGIFSPSSFIPSLKKMGDYGKIWRWYYVFYTNDGKFKDDKEIGKIIRVIFVIFFILLLLLLVVSFIYNGF